VRKIIIKNFWLKVSAFFLAIIVWLYVVGELNKGTLDERAFFEKILPYKAQAVEVPIKVTLIGKPLTGYRILNERISVKPSTCVIIASKNLLKNIEYATTEEIDISEFTKSVVKQVRLKPVGTGIILEKHFFVTVAIPVEKIE